MQKAKRTRRGNREVRAKGCRKKRKKNKGASSSSISVGVGAAACLDAAQNKRANSERRDRPSLVRVVGDKRGCISSFATGATAVLAEIGQAVGLGALEQRSLGSFHVLVLAHPRPQTRLLEGAAIGEGERPGLLGVELVHLVERERSLLFRHATGEESNARHGNRNGVLEHANCSFSNL